MIPSSPKENPHPHWLDHQLKLNSSLVIVTDHHVCVGFHQEIVVKVGRYLKQQETKSLHAQKKKKKTPKGG